MRSGVAGVWPLEPAELLGRVLANPQCVGRGAQSGVTASEVQGQDGDRSPELERPWALRGRACSAYGADLGWVRPKLTVRAGGSSGTCERAVLQGCVEPRVG